MTTDTHELEKLELRVVVGPARGPSPHPAEECAQKAPSQGTEVEAR